MKQELKNPNRPEPGSKIKAEPIKDVPKEQLLNQENQDDS